MEALTGGEWKANNTTLNHKARNYKLLLYFPLPSGLRAVKGLDGMIGSQVLLLSLILRSVCRGRGAYCGTGSSSVYMIPHFSHRFSPTGKSPHL